MRSELNVGIRKAMTSDKEAHYGYPFYLILLFIFFDYVRPQSLIPGISFLKIGMVLQLLLLFSLILRSNFGKLKNIQSKYFVALILLMTIHVPIATNNYWAFQTWKSIVLYFIVYLSIVSFVDSLSKIEKIIQVWITINLFCAVYGLLHGGKIPDSSFLGDENDFALLMDITIPLAFFMALKSHSMRTKLFYICAICVFVMTCVVSFSRGGFVGLVVAAIYCWYHTQRKILAAVLISMLIGIMYIGAPQGYSDRIKSITEQGIEMGTGESRWYSWTLAWRMFLDHPIIGVGPGNYPLLAEDYQTEEELFNRNAYRRNMWGRAAHSLHFTILSELGLIGILLFYGMAYISYRSLKRLGGKSIIDWRKKDDLRSFRDDPLFAFNKQLKFYSLAVNGSLLALLVAATFISVFDYPHFWILIGLCSAVINVHNATIDLTKNNILKATKGTHS
jgi:O-antigen ligase